MICSHVKIIFFIFQAKRLPLLWLHTCNPVKSTYYMCCCMIKTSLVLTQKSLFIFRHVLDLEIFGKCLEMFVWPSDNFWRIFGTLGKVVGNLWKIVKNVVISMFVAWGFYIIRRKLHRHLDIQNFSSRVDKYFQHSKRDFISLCSHVISSIYFTCQ